MSAVGSSSYIAMVKANTVDPAAIPPTPAMQKVNFMSSDLGAEIDTTISENLRGDRRTSDVVITGFTVGGGYEFEMTYENSLADELMAAFMWSDWVTDTPAVGSSQLKDSDTYTPFFMERGHTDINEYFQYMGMSCNIWKMEFADQALVTGGYQFVGLTTAVIQTPTIDATYTDATTNPVFSAVTNIPEILIDGVVQLGCAVKEWSFELNNNVTPKTGVGKKGACATNAHKLEITGDLTIYFEDADLYTSLLAGTPFSFGWTMTDNLGNTYKFTLPKIKLDSNEIPIDGPDDILNNASYVALYDETADCMIVIERTDI